MRRGKAPAPAVSMTGRQKRLLTHLGHKHGTPQQTAKRIRILLLASEGTSHSQIKREVGVSYNTVLSWRRRWMTNYEELLLFEKGMNNEGVSDTVLLQRLSDLLKDEQRSGAPKVFTLDQEHQIVALACDSPGEHGLEMTDWTHEMLAKIAMAKGIVESISASHLGKILKKQSLTAP